MTSDVGRLKIRLDPKTVSAMKRLLALLIARFRFNWLLPLKFDG